MYRVLSRSSSIAGSLANSRRGYSARIYREKCGTISDRHTRCKYHQRARYTEPRKARSVTLRRLEQCFLILLSGNVTDNLFADSFRSIATADFSRNPASYVPGTSSCISRKRRSRTRPCRRVSRQRLACSPSYRSPFPPSRG